MPTLRIPGIEALFGVYRSEGLVLPQEGSGFLGQCIEYMIVPGKESYVEMSLELEKLYVGLTSS